jgi:methylmalonyl-CoA mutase C-terminal domain/subunit
MDDVRLFVGGIVPAQDVPELRAMGVADVFLPGASTQDAARVIEASVRAR